ncbi:MAG: DUF131 domain-containing protein [Archaeoglobaceae archaeon]
MNLLKVFVGLALTMLGLSLLLVQPENVEAGAVVIIGPIPIVLASNTSLLLPLVLLAAAVLVLLLVLRW